LESGTLCPPKKTAISTIEMPYEPSRDPKVQTMQAKSTLNDLCIVSDGDGLHVIIGSNGFKAMAMLLFARHCLHIIIGNVSVRPHCCWWPIPCHNVWLRFLFRANVKSQHPVKGKSSMSS